MYKYALLALPLLQLSSAAPHGRFELRQADAAGEGASAAVIGVPVSTDTTVAAAAATTEAVESPAAAATTEAAASSAAAATTDAVESPAAAATTDAAESPAAAATTDAAAAAATTAAASAAASGAGSTAYTFYKGDGSTKAGWPDKSAWVADFETMFNSNKKEMSQACANNKAGDNDSEEEISAIHDSIKSTAASSGVDARFILAVVMQESKGCVRIKTTKSHDGIENPGLMQSFKGIGTCDGKTPCPNTQIKQMIKDGTLGEQGLNATLAAAPNKNEAQGFYQAARFYNAGLGSGSDDLGAPGATRCYSTDIANRLTGWNEIDGGETLCDLK